jgi:hypothetical protein
MSAHPLEADVSPYLVEVGFGATTDIFIVEIG